MLKSFYKENTLEAGIDEAGRGTLIGRVYAGAVIWSPETDDPKFVLNDSKKISKKRRLKFRDYIIENAIDYGIGHADEKEVDKLNILNATILAMHRAIQNLTVKPELLLVDGNRFEPVMYKDMTTISYQCIKSGDATYKSIAAASILAKVFHDEYIQELVNENPELEKYDLLSNMGYGTKKHMKALIDYGPTKYHRFSFGPCRKKKYII